MLHSSTQHSSASGDATSRCASIEDLGRYRYYTGAQPTPLHPGEMCPPLFRDVGLDAMATFLNGGLKRLCGPVSPVTFLRTGEYREPYTDYGRIGRIMLLQPKEVNPWHSGIESIYISARETSVRSETMVFIPGEIPLAEASSRFSAASSLLELQEAFGAAAYREATAATIDRLRFLKHTHTESELIAGPLRRMFQSMEQRKRDRARDLMQQRNLNESDLCTAWHHLPDDRRLEIQLQLRELREELL